MIDLLVARILMIVPVTVLGIFIGLLYKGIDRRLAARMQARIGPPLVQPFRDVKKLMLKENIVPRDAVAWVFNLMPFVALASSIVLLMYVPLFGYPPLLEGHGDLMLVLYMLMFPSLALVIGGFASSSPYATVGAQREMITMVSYEFPLAITIVALAWLVSATAPGAAAFSFSAITAIPVWHLVGVLGSIGLALLFAVIIFVTTGEMGEVPFDSAEAETEIAGGLLSEYSGRNLALFYLASAIKILVLGSVVIALFIPFGISGYAGLSGIAGEAADIGFFLVKLFIVMFISSTFIRVAAARFRITQVVKIYWGYTTMIALLGLVLIGLDIFMGVI